MHSGTGTKRDRSFEEIVPSILRLILLEVSILTEVAMVVRNKRRVLLRERKSRKPRKRVPRFKSRKAQISRFAILEKSGLIGCLTGTGVTSKNYKNILYKK